MVIRRIGVLSLGKIAGALYGGMGLLLGAVISVISLFGAAFAQAAGENAGSQLVGLVFGVGAIAFFPILYGVMGFIAGVIGALIYNLVAGIFGGLQLEVESSPPTSSS